MKANWRERIVVEPGIHHGEPCIKGTRVPVSVIVASIADGDTPQQIIDAWPQLTGDDIKAALKFAAEAVNNADFVSSLVGDGDAQGGSRNLSDVEVDATYFQQIHWTANSPELRVASSPLPARERIMVRVLRGPYSARDSYRARF